MFKNLKDKAQELALTGALTLAGLQIVTPMFVDVLFDAMIIGLLYVSNKLTK